MQAFVREMIKTDGHITGTAVNLTTGPSNKWFRGFLKRHPDVTLRTPDTIDRGRYGMANQTVMARHFALLQTTLKDLGNKITKE